MRAPAKLNLCLYVGPRREADGLHALASIFCPLLLADRLEVRQSERDVVVCPGVEGPNLVSVALDALRARGWRRPPLRIEIDKRIPVAAGLGGGSADAAALLRLASDELTGLPQLAAGLGADVPSQLDPVFSLVTGGGERIEPLGQPGNFGLVLIPSQRGLGAGEVYAAADRLGGLREPDELDELATRLRVTVTSSSAPLEYLDLLVNDLERAVLSIRPEIAEALDALTEVGAIRAMVTGSGPTAFGIFADQATAERAALELPPRYLGAIVSAPQRQGLSR